MAKKVAYLETSPEKFQQQHGDGSSSTDSHTHTGNRTAAILQPKDDSSLPMETLLKPPSDDSLEMLAQYLYESRSISSLKWDDLADAVKGSWRKEVTGEAEWMKRPAKPKPQLPWTEAEEAAAKILWDQQTTGGLKWDDLSQVTKIVWVSKARRENGVSGETSPDLLQFWKQNIRQVPSKE